MKNDCRAKAAFTLAELMVVIVIIGILAGLLLPAVIKSRAAATLQTARSQVGNLAVALDGFQSDFGFYPPTDRAYNPTTGQWDVAYDGGDPRHGYAYSEALVFCLCNRWTKGAGDTTIQGVERVIGNAPVNGGPYFEVKKAHLTDLDNDGWMELSDPWGNPYIYVPSDDYTTVNGLGETVFNAGALVWIDVDADDVVDMPALDVPPLEPGYVQYQRFKYQLISRGPDGWTPGLDNDDADGDGLPDGYKDISINGNDPADGFRPDLIGTDTEMTDAWTVDKLSTAPFNTLDTSKWGRPQETADDINNW